MTHADSELVVRWVIAARTPDPRRKLRRPRDVSGRRHVGSRSGRGPIVRWACPTSRRPRAVIPRDPCPTSALSARCASSRPASGTSQPSSRRPTTSSMPRPGSGCSPAIRPTSSGWTCRSRSSATSPTTATGGRPGRSPRGARTGPCARTPTRPCTPTSRPIACPDGRRSATQRGFFARLRLEPFGPDAGVLPHERTLAGAEGGPLQAASRDGRQHQPGRRAVRRPERRGDRRRLPPWPADRRTSTSPTTTAFATGCGRCRRTATGRAEHRGGRLLAAAEAGPITIADGHHRYETALRYRDERRMTRSCEEDPPFDYLLTLFLEASGEPLTVLPTHRLVRGIGEEARGRLLVARATSCSRSSRSRPRTRWSRLRRRPAGTSAARAGSGCGRGAVARSCARGATPSSRSCRPAARPSARST